MNIGSQARADMRVLVSAAVIGSSVGIALGAAYMAGGMARAASDHTRVERIAEATDGRFSDTLLVGRTAGMEPTVLRLAEAHDPFSRGDSERDRQEQVLEMGLQQATLARSQRVLDQARDLDCLAQAVYFEARGESPRGQAAVAQVVLNRVKSPVYPKSVCAVVYQGAAHPGCQFSFACDGSMRHGLEYGAWQRARKVAARALAGVVVADIGSATHYHTTAVSPSWSGSMLRVAQVGLHVFYKFNPRARYLTPAPERAVLVAAPAASEPRLRLTMALAPAEAANAAPSPTAEAAPPAPAPVAAAPAPKLQGSAPPAGLTPTSGEPKPAQATTTAS